MQKILAVEDSASMRRLVSMVLEEAGFDVVLAEDGQEALDYAKENGADVPDLVLTDINMPNVNGFELIEGLRQLDAYKYIPMLVLTTEAGSDKKNRGREVGATGWLVKPFDPVQLVAVMRKVLN